MHALNLKHIAKNLTRIAAGALMATMIAVPLSGNANAKAFAASDTYTFESNNGLTSTFELVERDGEIRLVLVESVYPDSGHDDVY